MLKEIIASVLLSTCSCTKAIQPHRAFENQLYGSYCLIDKANYIDDSLSGTRMIYDCGDYNGHVFVYYYDTRTYEEVGYFYIDYKVTYPNSIYVYVEDLNETEILNENIYLGSGPDGYDDCSTDLMACVVYFDDYYYASGNSGKLFRNVFGNEPNEYVYAYTGWYTFNGNINTVNEYFNLYGNVTVGNSLYNHLYGSHESDNVFYLQSQYSINRTILPYHLHDDTGWHSSQLVYFTGVLIPEKERTVLLQLGMFNYVPDVPNTSLTELIFSVVDSPVYFLYSMLNFEVFGTSLFIAFCSLVTCAVLIFVAKKFL